MLRNLTLFLLLAAMISPHDPPKTPTFDDSVCEACRCYRIKCDRLSDPGTNCEDTFKDTCDFAGNIVEEFDCEVKCDCCLKGKCYFRTSYSCMMFRALAFFSVLYFIASVVNFFLITKLFTNYFTLKRIYRKSNFEEKIVKNEDNHFKFKKRFWLWLVCDPVNQTKDRWEDIRSLFDSVEDQTNKAKINIRVVLVVTLIYIVLVILNIYVWFRLVEEPFIYIKVVWIQHVLHIIFYVLYCLGFFKIERYSEVIKEQISEFEKRQKCAMRIFTRSSSFIVNWEPVENQYELSKLLEENGDADEGEEEEFVINNKVIKLEPGKTEARLDELENRIEEDPNNKTINEDEDEDDNVSIDNPYQKLSPKNVQLQ